MQVAKINSHVTSDLAGTDTGACSIRKPEAPGSPTLSWRSPCWLSDCRVSCPIRRTTANLMLFGCQASLTQSFPDGSAVKNPPANAGDAGSILGGEDPLDKEIATHSRILARRILWTEEPGRLQSTGLQRVEYNLVTKQQQIFNTANMVQAKRLQRNFIWERTALGLYVPLKIIHISALPWPPAVVFLSSTT